jgi:hypothetical protein
MCYIYNKYKTCKQYMVSMSWYINGENYFREKNSQNWRTVFNFVK